MTERKRTGTVPIVVRRAIRRSRILEAAITGILASLILIGFLFLWERLDPSLAKEPFTVEILSSQLLPAPLDSPASERRCTLQSGTAQLRIAGQLPKVDTGEPVAPGCSYIVYWEEEGVECLVEFPLVAPMGLRTEGLMAALAEAYYDMVIGGVVYVQADETTTTLLMVDSRWCAWLGVQNQMRLVH